MDGHERDGHLYNMGALLSEKEAPGTHMRGGMDRLLSRFFSVHIKSVPLLSMSLDFSLDSSSVLKDKTC